MRFDELATGPAPQLPLEAFQRRRERVADALGDGTLVVATNPEVTYSNDVEHRFRPHSDFWYLTGFNEPGAVLVLDGGGRSTLFCRIRDPKAEVWTGRRLGVHRAKDALGMDAVLPSEDLPGKLKALLSGEVQADTCHNPEVDEAVQNACDDPEDGARLVGEFRVRKDAAEIAMLQKACDVGAEAMRHALPLARPGSYEYEVEAELLRRYRMAGSTGPGYPPIVGAGANAAVLHYIENNRPIRDGDLVLVDAGCEWGYYNSDITRTVPASGAWSGDQERLYTVVWEAQQAAMQVVRPGRSLKDVHDAAARVLAGGLADLGWLKGDVDAILAADGHRGFFMHGTSHYLGLDVHDVGRYKEEGVSRSLEPGMVITVEPGLYANPDFTDLPPGVDPFGIRIENDVVVTEDGPLDLLAGLPADPDGALGLLHKR